jgi:hypothetical protein
MPRFNFSTFFSSWRCAKSVLDGSPAGRRLAINALTNQVNSLLYLRHVLLYFLLGLVCYLKGWIGQPQPQEPVLGQMGSIALVNVYKRFVAFSKQNFARAH